MVYSASPLKSRKKKKRKKEKRKRKKNMQLQVLHVFSDDERDAVVDLGLFCIVFQNRVEKGKKRKTKPAAAGTSCIR